VKGVSRLQRWIAAFLHNPNEVGPVMRVNAGALLRTLQSAEEFVILLPHAKGVKIISPDTMSKDDIESIMIEATSAMFRSQVV
jgi:hypothetical protein